MIEKEIVGRRIAELRKAKGMSQKELAEKIGVSTASLSWWENGKSELNYQTISWYADFFGVTTDYLLGRSDEQTQTPPIPEPSTIAAHETENAPPITEERMREIAEQVFDQYVRPKMK